MLEEDKISNIIPRSGHCASWSQPAKRNPGVKLFEFSTNLLLKAVTFVPEILDEQFPSLILIQALCLGRTMQEQRMHSGKLLC